MSRGGNKSDCLCYTGCPEKDTAACPWRQAENQVKELLLERKVLRETFAESARKNIKVAEQTPTNSQSVAALYAWRDEYINSLSIPAWTKFNIIVECLHSEAERHA